MKKLLLAAVAGSALFASSAQAGQVGLIRGLAGTGMAFLEAPALTFSNIMAGQPGFAGNIAPFGLNFFDASVAFLSGEPIPSSIETISVPLAGPEFLNANLVNLPGMAYLNVRAAGPIVVTYATGERANFPRATRLPVFIGDGNGIPGFQGFAIPSFDGAAQGAGSFRFQRFGGTPNFATFQRNAGGSQGAAALPGLPGL